MPIALPQRLLFLLSIGFTQQLTGATPVHPLTENNNVTAARVGERWTFVCPHISSSYRNLTAQWSKDGKIMLEITNGRIMISNGMNSFLPMSIFEKHFIRVIQKQRYTFLYNEAVGDFDLAVDQMINDDSGHYVCTITLTTDNRPATQRKTEAILQVTGDDRHQQWDPRPFLTQRTIPTPPVYPLQSKGHKLKDNHQPVVVSQTTKLFTCSSCMWLSTVSLLLLLTT